MGPAATSASQFQASSNASSYHGPTRLCGGSLVCTGALSPTHIGPMPRTRARWSACGQRRPGTYLTVYVRNKELTRIFRSPHACNTPRQTPNPPKRRPIQPKQPVFSVFCPMGLHFGGHITSSRGRAATKRGELHDTGVRHADNTPSGGFMSCKTPTATQQASRRAGTHHQTG